MSKLWAWRFVSVVMALVLILQLGFLAGLPVPTVAADPVVTFPDANLETVIRLAISKPTGDIYASELAVLTRFDASDSGIINLSGLEYCTDLTDLVLDHNQIGNLAPLAGLTNLTYLDLGSNQITNLALLSGLTNLASLSLYTNQISDLAPLAVLTNLTLLRLDCNQISDLAPLAGLTNLTYLDPGSNQISDLAPLAGLTNLTHLYLYNNLISDIAPLVNNVGLGTGDNVDMRGNPLNTTSLNVYIPALRVRGVTVLCDTAWPMFHRDPQHTGRSPYAGPQTNTIKWAYGIVDGVGSPIIGSDGTVYVGSGNYKLYAINPNGTLQWSYTTGGGVGCPAVGSDGTLYVGSGDNKLYAINPNGTLKWSYSAGGNLASITAIGGDGTIYVGSSDNKLYAFNTTGTLKWYYLTDGYVRGPAVGSDGTVYFVSCDRKLYAVNTDGTLKWSYTTGDVITSSPAVGTDGTIFVGSWDNKLYAINPNGSLKWSYATGQRIESSPAIGSDGTVYVGSYDNKLYAVNPNGSLKWSYATGSPIPCPPSIGGDGTIYIGSKDHKLYAIHPNGNLVWSYTTGGEIWSSPAIGSDGTLYIGDDRLYAFGPQLQPVTPMTTADGATSITLTSATLNGNLTSDGGSSTSVTIYWGTIDGGTTPGSWEHNIPLGSISEGTFSTVITGLAATNIYRYRCCANNSVGSSWSNLSNFVAGASPGWSIAPNDIQISFYGQQPWVDTGINLVTGDKVAITASGIIHIAGSDVEGKNPSGNIAGTTVDPQCSTGLYGASLIGRIGISTPFEISTGVTFFSATTGRLYLGINDGYTADNWGGPWNVIIRVTNSVPPTVTTNPATNITTNSATLNGNLSSIGTAASCNITFQWGTSPGSYTTETNIQTKTYTDNFTANLSNLTPNTTYYFIGKAVGDGTGYGEEQSFTTGTTPLVVTLLSPGGGEVWQVGTTQNITWQASSIDPTAIFNYTVKLSTNSGATYPATDIVILPNQPQGPKTFSWAVTDNVSSHCKIKVVVNDNFGNSAYAISPEFSITVNQCARETASITIHEGWNLISLQIMPTNTNIESVLASILPNLIVVFYYDSTLNSWSNYVPGLPSSLNTVGAGKGYWVRMASGGSYSLTYQGSPCPCPPYAPPTFQYVSGWNYIGFKSKVPMPVAAYLDRTDYRAPVYSGGEPPIANVPVNTSDNMTPGVGYWVYFWNPSTLNPGCNSGPTNTGTRVLSENATNLGNTYATLNGYLAYLGNSSNTTVSFNWGTNPDQLSHSTPPRLLNTIGAYSENLTGLSPNISYYFQAIGTGDGISTGFIRRFSLPNSTPSVNTGAAINMGPTSATLTSNMASLGSWLSCDVGFDFGTTTDFGSATMLQSMSLPGNFNATLTGLSPNTTYYYRAKAIGNSTTYGETRNFTTTGQPWQITTSTNTGTLTLQSNLGNITSLSAVSIQTLPNWPPLLVFPHGLLYYEVSNIAPGATVTFTITFPIALPSNIQYWKYQPGHGWFQIPITSHNGNTITIQLTDGGLGDADGIANGVIVDPGGVAVPGSSIGTGAPTSHGASMGSSTTTAQPVTLPNIQIQSASLSATKVSPGAPVTVTANVANRGTGNGTMRIKLYVNGEEDSSQGVTVESGGNRSVYFTVSRNQPGAYTVYIGGTQAGSFTVDDAIDPNIILFISLSLIALSLMLAVIVVARRKLYY